MTPDEIDAVLDQYFADTVGWDPMLNGVLEAEPGPRDAAWERHRFEHDYFIGQRGAVQCLRQRFRAAAAGKVNA